MTDLKKIAVLGSTGSIGTQALDVVRSMPCQVIALATYHNISLLEAQIREFHPSIACVMQEEAARDLKIRIADTSVKIVSGIQGLCECAVQEQADIILNAVVGMVGLEPTLCAIETGKTIALANKETLVAGGQLVMRCAKEKGVNILPVDSEHSAVFQCLQENQNHDKIKKIILTASGGPFFGKTSKELENVKPEDALKHPNWSMGRKITIDSATMINKGLELIEACWLFDVLPEKIEIVVHRESIIHSMVEYCDNAVIAQLGVPDMRLPIQYAITYPERIPSHVNQLDLLQLGKLTFHAPDEKTFGGIVLCREAFQKGGLCPAIVNGANEEAVALFLEGKIGFNDICKFARLAMESIKKWEDYTLADVLEADLSAREFVRRCAE